MTGMATLEQIQRMPKLELHIHLEGTFDPETVCLLAEMQGISLPRPRQHLFDFSGLSDFLDLLDWICSLVQNRETAQQIAYRHAKYAQEQGILYTEIIVNPSHWKNIRTGELLTGVLEGFDQAGADGLPDCRLLAVAMPLSWLPLISDYTRDAEKPTQATWVSVLVYGAVSCWMYVIGMGAAIFTGEYDIAVIMVKAGLGIAVHAGESSGPEGVQEALELLGAKRIDHGVRAVEDLKLLERLLRERIPLNICYTSNVAGGLYTPGNHPLGELYSRGISVTVNTDDPQLLRVSLSQELQRVAEQYHWKIEELLKLQYYAVDAAFCTEERRSELLSRLHQFEATCQNLTAF